MLANAVNETLLTASVNSVNLIIIIIIIIIVVVVIYEHAFPKYFTYTVLFGQYFVYNSTITVVL